jgi:hypothetical protein
MWDYGSKKQWLSVPLKLRHHHIWDLHSTQNEIDKMMCTIFIYIG